MNKRITSFMLCFVMVFSLLATAVPALAAQADQITIIPDKKEAQSGDTITYTISLGSVSTLGGMQVTFTLPTGMTYVANSAKLGDMVKDSNGLKADTAHFNENLQLFINVGDIDGYTSNNDVILGTFRCIVDSVATGTLTLNTSEATFIDDFGDPKDIIIDLDSSAVTITLVPIAVTNVTLNKATLTLTEGVTDTLIATVSPSNATDKMVSWKSDKEAVATVDNTGKITAVAEGTATITVTTTDGGKTASCVVTVEKAVCTHPNKTEHSAVPSSCIVLGNNKYYTCNDCPKVFKADGTTETTVEAETLTEYGSHVEETPATCTVQAICSVCKNPYGELKSHSFTEKIEDDAHLATSGDCQTYKTYYYDCAMCDTKGTETFTGTEIGNHKVSTAWTTENGKHFHKCTVNGCDYVEDTENCSGGTATCTAKAVCSVCKVAYGNFADHEYKTEWNQGDANGHWHDCENCSAHDAQVVHTPGVVATESTPQTCTECGYVITPATGHITHTADTSKWLYNADQHWHKCVGCDVKLDIANHDGGTATCTVRTICDDCGQAYGNLLDHVDNDGNEKCDECASDMHTHSYTNNWSMDADYHWHECECGDKDAKSVHTAGKWIIDTAATSNTDGSRHKECIVCGYIMVIETIPAKGNGFDYDEWAFMMAQLMYQRFTITAEAGHGGTITDEGKSTVMYNNNKSFVITPDEGYEIEAVYVNGKYVGKNTEYTFRNVKSNQTIAVTFVEVKWNNPFIDIFESDSYYDAIEFVYENGLFKGISVNEFAPETTMTRAMFVTVLGRLAGVNTDYYTGVSFEDVVAGEWYAPYVEWAASEGIVNGYGDGMFGIDDEITVEQAAVILARYANYIGLETASEYDLGEFTDSENVAVWSKESLAWAVENDIYEADDELEPQKKASRSLIATMLYNFVTELLTK